MEQGHAEAQVRLGGAYSAGEGVSQDRAEAIRWWRRAAEQGRAETQYLLGLMYHLGLGVPQNYLEAVRWSRLAAEQGVASAQHRLGKFYYDGVGVSRSYEEAYIWLSVAFANDASKGTADRDAAERRLTPAQLATAQTEANRRFHAIAERQALGIGMPVQQTSGSSMPAFEAASAFAVAFSRRPMSGR